LPFYNVMVTPLDSPVNDCFVVLHSSVEYSHGAGQSIRCTGAEDGRESSLSNSELVVGWHRYAAGAA
jgi:hypothetical protein